MRTLVFITAISLSPLLGAADKPAPHTLIIPAERFRPVAAEPAAGAAKQALLQKKGMAAVQAPEPDPLVAKVAADGSLILEHRPAADDPAPAERPE